MASLDVDVTPSKPAQAAAGAGGPPTASMTPVTPGTFERGLADLNAGIDQLEEPQRRLTDWLIRRVRLPGLKSEMWTAEHHQMLSAFLFDHEFDKLICYLSNDEVPTAGDSNRASTAHEESKGVESPGGSQDELSAAVQAAAAEDDSAAEKEGDKVYLQVLPLLPGVDLAPRQYFYFAIADRPGELTIENVREHIKFGLVTGGTIRSMLRVMSSVFIPAITSKDTWPEGVKQDFVGHMHRFMASLTETANQALGKTVLYLPDEMASIDDPMEAGRDKALVQRLQSIVVFWTRQVREVISQQQDASSRTLEAGGPLQEIGFWKARTADLSSISDQLVSPGVVRVVETLRSVKNQYLGPFDELSARIQKSAATAQNNLRFTMVLQEPCESLAAAQPSEIPGLLPEILNRIRFVGAHCEYFFDPDKLAGLLCRVSSEIIRRCSDAIDMNEVLDGDVLTCMDVITDCLTSGREWHRLFDRARSAVRSQGVARKGCDWSFDENTVFAQLNAFMERCRDVRHICESQTQFARKTVRGSAAKSPLPVFGGTRGPEIVQGLEAIESKYSQALDLIRGRKAQALDVRAAQWPETNASFTSSLSSLEAMMKNLITSAFAGLESVLDAVQLIESFSRLARLPSVKAAVASVVENVWRLFEGHLKRTKEFFDRHSGQPPIAADEPEFAGAALWTRGLLLPLEREVQALRAAKHYLPPCSVADRALRLWGEHSSAYDAYMQQKHQEWMADMADATQEQMAGKLQLHLLHKVRHDSDGGAAAGGGRGGAGGGKVTAMRRSKTGYLENNFDTSLLKLFNEVHGWEKFGGKFFVPFYAADLKMNQMESLRVVREQVQLVVNDYNAILDSLKQDERQLFGSELKGLDSAVAPGILSISWNADPRSRDRFVRNCRVRCAEVQAKVDSFHGARQRIARVTRSMRGLVLVDIDRDAVQTDVVFARRQKAHRERLRHELAAAHAEQLELLVSMYDMLRSAPTSRVADRMWRAWVEYLDSVDADVGRALMHAVKTSLQDLEKAIVGDRKSAETDNQPLFRINFVLEGTRLDFQPDTATLTQMIQDVATEMMTVVAAVPRLRDAVARDIHDYKASRAVLAERERALASGAMGNLGGQATSRMLPQDGSAEGLAASATGAADQAPDADGAAHVVAGLPQEVGVESQLPSFYDTISCENALLDIVQKIWGGASDTALELNNHAEHYAGEYSSVYANPKDKYFQRRLQGDQSLASYEADIAQYQSKQDTVQAEESSRVIGFVLVDNTLFKQALLEHCESFQRGLTGLLHDKARRELQRVTALMQGAIEQFERVPGDLSELNDAMKFLRARQAGVAELEGDFAPLEAMFAALKTKMDVQLPEEEREMLEGMRGLWTDFTGALSEADESLRRVKQSMKKDLQDRISSFNSRVEQLAADAKGQLPVDAEVGLEGARRSIADFQARVQAIRQQEEGLRPGLELFEIPTDNPAELVAVEGQLEKLQTVWDLVARWEVSWEQWKQMRFVDIDPKALEAEGLKYKQQVAKLRSQLKTWGVWKDVDGRVRAFLATMPLIQDLGSEAMRDRHWATLKEELHVDFDEKGDAFTLEAVSDMGLFRHADFIGELAAHANKELAIERDLQEIQRVWADMVIPMVAFKSAHTITNPDDLFQQLEDDTGTLSTIRASGKYYQSFKSIVDEWEAALSRVSEVVELQLQVQRAWMYLESIFMASEDIRMQMAAASADFDRVNEQYRAAAARMFSDPNALRSCGREGYIEELQAMEAALDDIQNRLNAYLERKRQDFPRFYFISNADLLEILGQSTNPPGVQKHMKGCFEGIKRLQLRRVAANEEDEDDRRGGGAGDADGEGGVWEAFGMTSPKGERLPFERPVRLEGAVEGWLNLVEDMMRITVRKYLRDTLQAFEGRVRKVPLGLRKFNRLKEWIHKWPGQLHITTALIQFTRQCQEHLALAAEGDAKALKRLVKAQRIYLKLLAGIVGGQIDKLDRRKITALITIELHSRDVMTRLYKEKVTSPDEFSWLAQLRLQHERVPNPSSDAEAKYGQCVARQTTSELLFGYEYQGNNGRLVVTPLTDRCVLTLTTALFLNRGGAPAGPAGTGKTETVKDLGKNLAKYVVVTNCSDALDYKSVGRMFSGLVQSGSWGCFDEFNRILIEVLSVVAQQVRAILDAIREGRDYFDFMGEMIRCRHECGIFITMNPGYAGRTELPDNLKSLFRPVAMMVPDMQLIAEVMLQAEGFEEPEELAEKTNILYNLMQQQLSKQDHYDFGLRSMRGVLMAAGALKRSNAAGRSEEEMMLQAIRDMNVPKFIKDDKRLFLLLLGDLFPGLDLPEDEAGDLVAAIDEYLEVNGYQKHDAIRKKCIELRDSKDTRHCNMLVGLTMSGKSVCWKTLAGARSMLAERGVGEYTKVKTKVINPKAVTMFELYGAFDLQTMEWTDGVLSTVFREFAKDEREDEKWLVLDGPVDTLWIESMNTVMDDNKTLTLINGDRISMSSAMSLVFEVPDLAVASPATVSRAGMIYLDVADLGWQPFVTSWLERHFGGRRGELPVFQGFFEKYLPVLLDHRHRHCKEPVPCGEFNAVTSLCNLLEATSLRDDADMSLQHLGEAYAGYAEKWFAFCLVWSVGGNVDEDSRRKINDAIREVSTVFPAVGSVYDYFVDPKSKEFKAWQDQVSMSWKPPAGVPFGRLVVPTVDTVRNSSIITSLILARKHTLVVGGTGTGKTILIQQQLELLNRETHSKLLLNFSAATQSGVVQEVIEGAMEKAGKSKLKPPGGRALVAFVDDLNMPKKDTFGSQPPLELLRQWLDYGIWYDRKKQTEKEVLDMQLVAAMGPPGGGRTVISPRIQSCFNMLNFTFPAEKEVKHIFEAILGPTLSTFEEEARNLTQPIVAATTAVYLQTIGTFLPTPQNCHYLFNMREIAAVIQGVMQATPKEFSTREAVMRLWAHETQRVFSDRFTSKSDQLRFRGIMDEQLQKHTDLYMDNLMGDCENVEAGPVMVRFSGGGGGEENGEYVEATDMDALKALVDEELMLYNDEPKMLAMDLVLFRDAIRHVARIHRVLSLERGNALLVGVGGSGRQSLTRLAAWLTNRMDVFTIEIRKNYNVAAFHEDLKALYRRTGLETNHTAFLMTDTQITEESFLEDINNILSSGEVPNLFEKEEQAEIFEVMGPIAAKMEGVEETPDEMWALFIERVRSHLHVVLAMSPIGDAFRDRTRMYPSLVSACTIDWFHEWPAEALQEVGLKFLAEVTISVKQQAVPGAADEEAAEAAAGAGASSARGAPAGGSSGAAAAAAAAKAADEAEEAAEAQRKSRVAEFFAVAHRSVSGASRRMHVQLKRRNYVTPTNFLELVTGYRALLAEKRREVGVMRDKLANGLGKLVEGAEDVSRMSVELEKKKEIVTRKAAECDRMLETIIVQRHGAEEKQAAVSKDREVIQREEAVCSAIAAEAEAELSKAMPALDAAKEAVDRLQEDKGLLSEVKKYPKPPALAKLALMPVMILLGCPTDWDSTKKKLSEANFLQQIISYPKDKITDSMLRKMAKYIKNEQYDPDLIVGASRAAAALATWVVAMNTYAHIFREVEPKQARLNTAQQALRSQQKRLAAAEAELAKIVEQVAALQAQLDAAMSEKEALETEASQLELKLERAGKLVSGLSGERDRWQQQIGVYQSQIGKLPGDCLIAAAFLSYAGPFDTAYRADLTARWMEAVQASEVPYSEAFSFSTFLAKPTELRNWVIKGLPADDFSAENGVIVQRGRRWPLMIDPQGQANGWIKRMEGDDLKVTDLKEKKFQKLLETAISYGFPYLLQDVEEELDPVLEPVLSKAIIVRGSSKTIRVGDKELSYNDDFRLYITTKLPNPHYTPEVSTKATIVNFAVKEEGLTEQLLSVVFLAEQRRLEERKAQLVVDVAEGKNLLVELENKILQLLADTEGSLLDDENLVVALQQSKTTSEETSKKLLQAQETEAKIDDTREGYRPVAARASLLYFVLDDLGRVDPMYQFSLDAYVDLFRISIEESKRTQEQEQGLTLGGPQETGEAGELKRRLSAINDFHTLAVYKYACRGLFERHKILLSLQICARKLRAEGKLPADEWDMFLKGGVVMDASSQRRNPCEDWLSSGAWDNVTEAERLLSVFSGLGTSFEQTAPEWRQWYMAQAPENQPLPADWEGKVSSLQRLLVVRMLRPDRVLFAVKNFVSEQLGAKFVDPPAFNLAEIFGTSTARMPLVFVLSPGVDPTKEVVALAKQCGKQIRYCSLGQGQEKVATEMMQDAIRNGTWVFLQNCHLSISWMPALEKIVEGYCNGDGEFGAPHEEFRLWLSSSPHPKFPISILQRGIKMTTEPPRGLGPNLLRLYGQVSDEEFRARSDEAPGASYKRLLFSLCWFHAVLLERRKFKALGWNIPYGFTQADFAICNDILSTYLTEYPDKTPWEAIRYLIAEANYGGRITDDLDRRLALVYVKQFFHPKVLSTDGYRLSELDAYYIPEDAESVDVYVKYIKGLPDNDPPQAFGQHPNADIQSAIEDTNDLLSTVLSLQPRAVSASGASDEDRVAATCADLAGQVPEACNMETVQHTLSQRDDPEPLVTCLLQELERYNALLLVMRKTLRDLQRGIKGLVVITPELEEVFAALLAGRVPAAWGFCYPSLKALGPWMRDLLARCEQMHSWSRERMPVVFWLSGFTYPTSFLTALLQTTARRNRVPINQLDYSFPVMEQDADDLQQGPKEGAYVRGLFLEGARWDFEGSCMAEPHPMELFCEMPVVHFLPKQVRGSGVKAADAASSEQYQCPLYLYPVRTGTRERPSFMRMVQLNAGAFHPDFWIKRGAALLLALAN